MNKQEFIHRFETEIKPKHTAELEKGKESYAKILKMRGILALFIVPLLLGMVYLMTTSVLWFLGALIPVILLVKLYKKHPNNLFTKIEEEMKYVKKNDLITDVVQLILPSFTYAEETIKKDEFTNYFFFDYSYYDDFITGDAVKGRLNDKNVRISELTLRRKSEEEVVKVGLEMITLFKGLFTDFQTKEANWL